MEVVREAADLLRGEPLGEYRRLVEAVRDRYRGAVSATTAIETALLDAVGREHDVPLSMLFGGDPSTVTTDVTIDMAGPETAAERAETFVDAGFTELKIKTGGTVADDVDRVVAVRDAAPDAELKVDANQGWRPKEAVRFADAMRERGVDLALLEQPVHRTDVDGMAQVRRQIRIPVAADESVFTPTDAMRIVRNEAADVLNVKLGKSGVLGAQSIASIALAANLDLMVGCMLESSIGLHTAAHLVSGIGAFSYVDLDGNLLLGDDVVDLQLTPDIEPEGPGHGIDAPHLRTEL